MAKKSSVGTKSSSQGAKKPTAVKKVEAKKAPPKVPQPEIKTPEQAKKFVEENFKRPDHLQYTVLSNGHVFYGINNGAAAGVAKRFGLEKFDVQL